MNTINTSILARSVDSEVLQSMFRRKRKNQGTLNTKLFSELVEADQKCFLDLLVIKGLVRPNEVLLIVSGIFRTKWMALSNIGVYYLDEDLKKVDYTDISECFANENKIGKKDFVDFIDNQDIEIMTKDGKEILLVAADTGHVNQTLADLISWSVHQINSSTCKSSPIG
jgi:hypothetical protein